MTPTIQTLGVDASLNGTGLCLFTGGDKTYELTQRELTMEKDKGVVRLRSLRTLLNEWLDTHDVTGTTTQLALIEGYAFGASGRIAQLGEWGGLLRVALADRGVPIAEMNLTHLKQFVTGKGNAQKDEMMLGIYKRFGREFSSNDAADAFALSAAAQVYCMSEEFRHWRWHPYFGRTLTQQEVTAVGKISLLWKPSTAAPRARASRTA